MLSTLTSQRKAFNRTQPPIMAQMEEKCPICVETIKEAIKQAKGQEALFCEEKWLHRWPNIETVSTASVRTVGQSDYVKLISIVSTSIQQETYN